MIIRRFHIIIIMTFLFVFLSKVYIYEEKIPKFTPHQQLKTKYVCLTFDDGPHPYYTKKIVDILKEENIKATFFLVGKQIEKYPDLVRYILSYNNAKIANHTYNHKNLTKMSLEELKEEIINTQKLLLEISSDNLKNIIYYVRPPGGNYNDKVFKEIKSLGYNLALWSIFPNDLLCKNKQDIVKKINEQTKSDKEVILLHSGNQVTLEALPDIIKLLKSKGYEFINIDEIKYETYNVN